MEIKKLQDQINKKYLDNLKIDGIKINDDYPILKLNEEVGEFVQSYLVHKKRCRPKKYLPTQQSKREMAKELSDVLGLVFVIAKNLGVDLEEALIKKWITQEWLKKPSNKKYAK